jgi:hypothetical protein
MAPRPRPHRPNVPPDSLPGPDSIRNPADDGRRDERPPTPPDSPPRRDEDPRGIENG